MSGPVVSVIICTYNQQEFIRETIESVIAQTYPHVEIIVSDDGSTDATPDILRDYALRYPDRVKIVVSETNTGIPANINRGLAVRTGELVAWLDGDDLMLPGKLEKQVAFLQSHPEATGCYHDAEVFESESGRTLGSLCQLYNGTSQLKQGQLRDWLRPRYYFIQSAIMCRSAACPAHGYDERLKQLSEVVFFAEVFRTGTLLAINEMLVRYRRHAHNLTGDVSTRALSQEYELIAYAILEARYPEQHALWKKARISCMLTEAVRSYREGDRRRYRVIVRSVLGEGAWVQSLAVWASLGLLGGQVSKLVAGQPYQRPGWIKRLSRLVLDR